MNILSLAALVLGIVLVAVMVHQVVKNRDGPNVLKSLPEVPSSLVGTAAVCHNLVGGKLPTSQKDMYDLGANCLACLEMKKENCDYSALFSNQVVEDIGKADASLKLARNAEGIALRAAGAMMMLNVGNIDHKIVAEADKIVGEVTAAVKKLNSIAPEMKQKIVDEAKSLAAIVRVASEKLKKLDIPGLEKKYLPEAEKLAAEVEAAVNKLKGMDIKTIESDISLLREALKIAQKLSPKKKN